MKKERCPVCKSEMKKISNMLLSLPPKEVHECKNCNYKKTVTSLGW